MPDPINLPSAKVVWWNASSIWVRCPYCEEIHRHGFASAKYELKQRRQSHCPGDSYYLAFPLSLSGDESIGYDIDKKRALFVRAGEDAADAQEPPYIPHDVSNRRKWTEATEMVSDQWRTQSRVEQVISELVCGNVPYVRQYLESSREADILLQGIDAYPVPHQDVAEEEEGEVEAREQVELGTEGKTALIYAAEEQSPDMVRLLLDFGADPNVGNIHGWTPLMAAALWGRLESVKILLERGADKERKCTSYGPRRYKAVDFAKPLPINSRDRNRTTPEMNSHQRDLDRKHIVCLLSDNATNDDEDAEQQGVKTPIFVYDRPTGRMTSLFLFAKFELTGQFKTLGVLWRGHRLPVKAAMSGWAHSSTTEQVPTIDGANYTNEVFELCRFIGHTLPEYSKKDGGRPGRFCACHAEKQLVAYLVGRHRFLPKTLPDISGLSLSEGQRLPEFEGEEVSSLSSQLTELEKVMPPASLRKATILVSRPVCHDCKMFIECVNDNKEIGIKVEVFHH
ncbi:hypothetical protein MCOR25_006138 [Pyricularia grisea]|nr:hypothetical protein MCOR25_006138 [Pyricularia grisea]